MNKYNRISVFFTFIAMVLVACSDTNSQINDPSSTLVLSSSSSDMTSDSQSSSEQDSSSNASSPSTVPSTSSSPASSISSSSSSALTNEQKIEADLASLNIIPGNSLQLFGPNGSSISWTTSHPNIISSRGAFIELPFGADPIDVTLTARAAIGGLANTRSIVIRVEAPQPISLQRVVQLPFTSSSEEYIVNSVPSVPVFFTETGNVPYMDIEDFFGMIDGAIDFSLLQFEKDQNLFFMSYSFEDEDADGNPVTYAYNASLDFNLNTLTVDNFGFFGNYVQSTETSFSDGLIFLGGYGYYSDPITIPLGNYRVDLVQYQGKYLMPISIMNLLFLHSIYYDVYYNGDALIGFDTFTALDADKTKLNQMRTSSLNTQTLPKDVRQSTYHFLALAFDYFYGLKPDKNIATFYDVLPLHMNNLLLGNDRNLYSELFKFIYGLDDLHSWLEAPGFYEQPSYSLPLTSLSQLGTESQAFYQGLWAMRDRIEAVYGVGNLPPSLRLLDDNKIAVIFFRNFSVDTPDLVKDILDNLPPTVESVVIDLAYNTGGNVGAVFRLFGYMTEEPIQYHRINPGDNSSVTYSLGSEYVAYDYDWYIASSSVTFSAANLMVSMAKELGIATIIGAKSSGGAASIGMFVTPDGTLLMRSTNGVFATLTTDSEGNPVYRSIEKGITPDFALVNPYDNNAITSLINQIRSQRA
jgi:carboxyl-terminal processing protease